MRFLYGKWTDYFKSADVADYDSYVAEHDRFHVPDRPDKHSSMLSKIGNITDALGDTASSMMDTKYDTENGSTDRDIKKSDSSNSLDIPNSKLLWIARPRPEYSAEYYNFGEFTMRLNELTDDIKKIIPPTDCRLRPDVRLLEEGDLGMLRNGQLP